MDDLEDFKKGFNEGYWTGSIITLVGVIAVALILFGLGVIVPG